MIERETVLSQLEEVRKSNRTNMSDRERVQEIAAEKELYVLHNELAGMTHHEYMNLLEDLGRGRRGNSSDTNSYPLKE